MGMFSFKSDEPQGSPLFAAMLGGSALGAVPATDAIRKHLLKPSLERVREALLRESVDPELVQNLRRQMLDREIRHIPIVAGEGSSFLRTGKGYLPERGEVETLLRSGGFRTAEGDKLSPLKAIRDARTSGGLIKFKDVGGLNPATLAHELGHATMLNKGEWLRGSKLHSIGDSLGRKALQGGSKQALVAALIAGGMSSEDASKWLVPGAVAATQLPLLYEEGTASVKGMKALRDIGDPLVSKETLKEAPKLLRRAWGTYGLGSAGLLAAPLLAIAARSQFDDYFKD